METFLELLNVYQSFSNPYEANIYTKSTFLYILKNMHVF